MSMPGTLVAIGRKTLLMPSGASGLRSNVSNWLGPPRKNSRITEVSVPAVPAVARRQQMRQQEAAQRQCSNSQHFAPADRSWTLGRSYGSSLDHGANAGFLTPSCRLDLNVFFARASIRWDSQRQMFDFRFEEGSGIGNREAGTPDLSVAVEPCASTSVFRCRPTGQGCCLRRPRATAGAACLARRGHSDSGTRPRTLALKALHQFPPRKK